MWHIQYTQEAIAHYLLNKKALNQAAEFWEQVNDQRIPEPEIILAQTRPGGLVWRCVGLYHLPKEINQGNHHLFCEAIGRDGSRQRVAIMHRWQGISPQELARIERGTFVDKPAHEPGAHIALPNSPLEAWVKDPNIPSDRVNGLVATYPDDKPGNTIGHHSFYAVWELQAVIEQAPEPEPEPPIPDPTPPIPDPDPPPVENPYKPGDVLKMTSEKITVNVVTFKVPRLYVIAQPLDENDMYTFSVEIESV